MEELESSCISDGNIKLPTSVRSYKKQEFPKKHLLLVIDYAKDCWITTHCRKFLKRREYWPTLPASCEIWMEVKTKTKTGATKYRVTDWLKIGKGVCQGCVLSPCLFNLHAEYIMRNAGLNKAQAGIKTARRNISNLRHVNDTTENEELKSRLMKVKKLA